MVLTLYSGVNYTEGETRSNENFDKHPFRRDKFQEQIIRVKVNNFEFNRRDESIYKNMYRMLNIKQLTLMEDTLSEKYYGQLQNYLVQIELNPIITRRSYNLVERNDSMRHYMTDVKADSIFDFDSYFNGIEKWKKAQIAQIAVDRARNNMQNLNVYQGQLADRKRNINKYSMERHRKFTLSLAVLIFFFVGAPLGAIIRKGGLGMPVVVSIGLFIAYYIVSMMGEKSAREDVWQMFVFLPAGIWLTYKAVSDSSIMSADTYSKIFSKLRFREWLKKLKGKSKKSA